MFLTNCTIARNLVQDNTDYANTGQWYDRGGGVYMGGGSLWMSGCTVAENAVNGQLAIISGKPNMGGGGVCATIGNAHTVETVWLKNSIVVGNTLNGGAEDWFPGSILDFYSQGYNLVGVVNFSWILVPVPDWMMSSRRRWPKTGDADGVTLGQALNVGGAQFHPTAISAGTDAGGPAILWYPPADLAADKIPNQEYNVTYVNAGYSGFGVATDDFLNYVILQLPEPVRRGPGRRFRRGVRRPDRDDLVRAGRDLADERPERRLGSPSGITSTRPSATGSAWPFSATISGGRSRPGRSVSTVHITVERFTRQFSLESEDQLGNARPRGATGDIGAIER